MDEPASHLPRPLAPLGLLKALAFLFVLYKVVLLFSAGVFQDEAYYWLWGQHPALSYFDHPPLNAWLQGLAGAIFGWNKLGLRIVVALALCADIVLIWLISKRVAWDWPEHFWRTLLLFLATPVFFAVTAVALPDHLLLTFSLAALYFFISFLQRWPELPRWRDLYFGAACLGLAGLSKYNAAFLGLGLAFYIVLVPRARPLLLKPQLYLAGAIAIALQAPVLIWNLQQAMASYGFILGTRHSGLGSAGLGGLSAWLVGFVLLVGPFLIVPLLDFAVVKRRRGEGVARVTFWISTLAILGIAGFTTTLFHWNLVAYLAALPFLAFHMRWRWLTWLHVAYGAAFLSFMVVNYSFVPLTDVKALSDEATSWAYGWDETAQAVDAVRTTHQTGFIATADYTTAALLGYALRDKDVTSLNAKKDQFDYWFDAAAHEGQDALLFGDSWRPLTTDVTVHFREVVLLQEIPVLVGGKEVNLHQIFLGRGFSAVPN